MLPDPAADDFLTGDLNLVTAEALVQYRVRDPAAYLFRTPNVEASLAAIAEWALTRALANRGIDELLTTGRAEVADGLTQVDPVAWPTTSGLGISIVAVRLGRVAPPSAVAPAFADAAAGRSDRRQAVTRAEEYRDRTRSEARGQAREIADAAAGRCRPRQPARGEADRFTQVLAEAAKNPGPFRQRLFLETLAELLPRFRRTVSCPRSGSGYQPVRRRDAVATSRGGQRMRRSRRIDHGGYHGRDDLDRDWADLGRRDHHGNHEDQIGEPRDRESDRISAARRPVSRPCSRVPKPGMLTPISAHSRAAARAARARGRRGGQRVFALAAPPGGRGPQGPRDLRARARRRPIERGPDHGRVDLRRPDRTPDVPSRTAPGGWMVTAIETVREHSRQVPRLARHVRRARGRPVHEGQTAVSAILTE